MNRFRKAIYDVISSVLTLVVLSNPATLFAGNPIVEDSQTFSVADDILSAPSFGSDERIHPSANKPLSFEENKGQRLSYEESLSERERRIERGILDPDSSGGDRDGCHGLLCRGS